MKAGVSAALAANVFYPCNARGKAAPAVPNIIFLHVDQMSLLDSIADYGAEFVTTPGINRLVQNGISFMQSYSTDPVCCPARSAWWTGTYPSENGIIINNTPCHQDVPDLSLLLQQAGYNTYYIGKWHVPGKDVRKLFHVIHEGSWWGELTDPEVTRSARSFIRNYKSDQPFFLSIGYLNPHDICITPSVDLSRAETAEGKNNPPYINNEILSEHEIPPLPSAHGYDEREPSILLAYKRMTRGKVNFSEWSEQMWRMHRYNYHRLVEMVDGEIELLLNELDSSPLRDNTLIIFSSDHGEGMGRHLGVGKSTFYEEVVKVPFVIASLGNKIRVRKNHKDTEHLVSGIDLGRTVCDYARAQGSKLPHGMSLRPLAENRDVSAWRDYVYAENSAYMHMVTDGNFKYVRGYEENKEVTGAPPAYNTHPLGTEQLFNLREDPGEQNNLAYDSRYQDILQKYRNAMNKEEDKRFPIRKVPHEAALNFMKTKTAEIREYGYNRKYTVV